MEKYSYDMLASKEKISELFWIRTSNNVDNEMKRDELP